MLEWLPDDGRLSASLQGGRAYLGWGLDRHIAVDRWDMHSAELTKPKAKPQQYQRPKPTKAAQGQTLRSRFPGR